MTYTSMLQHQGLLSKQSENAWEMWGGGNWKKEKLMILWSESLKHHTKMNLSKQHKSLEKSLLTLNPMISAHALTKMPQTVVTGCGFIEKITEAKGVGYKLLVLHTVS